MKRLLAGLMAAGLLAGCATMDYSGDEGEIEENDPDPGEGIEITTTPEATTSIFSENKTLDYNIRSQDYSYKLQAESIEGVTAYSALTGFEGSGYIQLEAGEEVSFTVDVPTSQHYTIGMCVCTQDSVTALVTGEGEQGALYVKENVTFSSFFLDSVYLRAGVNTITMRGERGIAYIDFFTVSGSMAPSSARYNVTGGTANRRASASAMDVYAYLCEIYGEKTLSGQHVTPGTNTEINAVYAATGRYPAIRASDIAQYGRSYPGADKDDPAELEQILAWAGRGGLVSLDWTWYSPGENSHYYAGNTDFRLNEAFTLMDIAGLDIGEIELLAENGSISQSCLELVYEIDHISAFLMSLSALRGEDVVVLWRPLMQAGVGWYWWGAGLPESYVWLWRLMFDRMTAYHGLSNLIWVWNGESLDFYPGDEYVDIISEDIYSAGETSSVIRFNSTLRYTNRRRLTAISETGKVPSPDLMARDNAMWLWFSLFKGDYIIGTDGLLSGGVNTAERLSYAYNHELVVTLDELPQF